VNPVNGLIIAANRLGSLPGPAKAILGILTGGSIIGIAYLALGGSTKAVLVLTIGLIAVFGVIVLYQFFLKAIQKRKANPLSQGLAGNAAAAPQGISEPARRARLDDLRRNFEQGVEKFRAAGKNLYSVPWYVLVGEPGSGKTEAIRHCNVGFPPGLQDQLQGAGGTLNMNWWFTNQAIILDTAGRLMFEEVAPGTTNEWAEFLKLLKQNRPNCPINGMLLVIPVDTLIKDSADAIEKKCTKIAQQFDQIQRTLGVRFPVFIIISKCDLLNGFREFFDDLNDPQLQHQIMGWSNPASLDERFDPTAVTRHLETVKQRLTERRQQLLLDPVNTEDAQGRRIDQVDALYALPDSITKIAPRLRRYLEMVFVAGEWSPKPLFLRGIYFTSSMTEGSALDAELAEVLGVPLDSLPEGRVWRRDRAYFLRDLFIEKVFREKGLVTRADNADKQMRTRRTIIMTCGFLAVLILGVLTFFGYRQLQRTIGVQRDFWTDVAEKNRPGDGPGTISIMPDKTYDNPTVNVLGVKKPLATFFDDTLKSVQEDIQIPAIFRPIALVTGSINDQRRTAFRTYYEATVLLPAYNAARTKIKTLTDDKWTANATLALAQLMKLEYAGTTGKVADVPHPQVEVGPLFRLVLPADDNLKAYEADNDRLQRVADAIYAPDNGPKSWPDELVRPKSDDLAKANLALIDTGVTRTINYWKRQRTAEGERMKSILAVQRALDEFRGAENAMLQLSTSVVEQVPAYNTFLRSWTDAYQRLLTAHDNAIKAWAAVAANSSDDATLESVYSTEIKRVADDADASYQMLLKLTPDNTGDASQPVPAGYPTIRKNLEDAARDNKAWATADNGPTLTDIRSLDADYLAFMADKKTRRFDRVAQLYKNADSFLVRKDGSATQPALAGALPDLLTALEDRVTRFRDEVGALPNVNSDAAYGKAAKISLFTSAVGARAQRYDLFTAKFNEWAAAAKASPDSTDTNPWLSYVAGVPQKDIPRPQVPLSRLDGAMANFPHQFSPAVVGSINDALTRIKDVAGDTSDTWGTRVLDPVGIKTAERTAETSFNAYLAMYKDYWSKGAFNELLTFRAETWADFYKAITETPQESVYQGYLKAYGLKCRDALSRVSDTTDAVGEIDKALSAVTDDVFNNSCEKIIGKWYAVGSRYADARTAVLSTSPFDFLTGYVIADSSKGFISRYWQAFTNNAINIIAKDNRADIDNAIRALQSFQHFPLVKVPGDPKEDLTAQQLADAAKALRKISVSIPAATDSGTTGPAALQAPIGTPNIPDNISPSTREALENLIGPREYRNLGPYFAKLDKLFRALPPDAATTMKVKLSIDRDRLKDHQYFDNDAIQYTYVQCAQGAKNFNVQLASTEPTLLDVTYPGGDLVFTFRDTLNSDPVKTVKFDGPWAPLRLLALHATNTEPKHDGAKWNFEIAVPDRNGNGTHMLPLILEFESALPDLKDWPNPPAKSANP